MHKYWSIQYFRALAALSVVTLHSWPRLCGNACADASLEFATFAQFGVELFFVISGLVMWLTTSGQQVYPNEFLVRRLFRIAPLYYFITILVAAAALVAPTLLQTTKFDLEHLLYSLMFVPSPHPANGNPWPVVVPGWSLNYEMYFYTIFSFALFLHQRWRLLAICGSILAMSLVGLLFHPKSFYLAFYTNPITVDFAVGVLLGAVVQARYWTGWVPGAIKLVASVVTGTLVLQNASDPHFAVATFSIPSVLAIWGLMDIESLGAMPKLRWLKWLGDISYSVYLVQMLTLAAFSVTVFHFMPVRGLAENLMFFVASIAITIGVAAFTYYLVELPSQSWARIWSGKVRAFEAGMQPSPSTPDQLPRNS